MVSSEADWNALVKAYEAARAQSDQAFDAYDALDPGASDDTPEEKHYETCRRIFEEAEDELLDAVAPNLQGVAYQIRIFGERFHQAVLDEAEMSGEDRPAGEFLRRILTGLGRASAG